MKVSPLMVVRALITRLSSEERAVLACELLDGVAAAPRPIRPSVMQPFSVAEECE